MFTALVVLVLLGGLSWFTIDSSAVVHVHGNAYMGIADRDVQVRWVPILFLGLFAVRTVLAYQRARLEERRQQER
jgi:hypothetical protein